MHVLFTDREWRGSGDLVLRHSAVQTKDMSEFQWDPHDSIGVVEHKDGEQLPEH